MTYMIGFARKGMVRSGRLVNWAAPLNRGLVGWWMSLNRPGYFGVGGPNQDLTGLNSNGTWANSPTWSGLSRPSGWGSVNYATASARSDMGTPTILQLPSQVSMSAWVLATSLVGFDFAAGYAEDSGASAGYGLVFFSSNIRFFANIYTTNASIGLTADSQWHHLVGTYDNSLASNQLNIYMDGVAGTPATQTATMTYTGTPKMRISTVGAGFTHWTGNIDDVRVYNRCLSQQEALQLYRASRGGYQRELNYVKRPIWGKAAAAAATYQPYDLAHQPQHQTIMAM